MRKGKERTKVGGAFSAASGCQRGTAWKARPLLCQCTHTICCILYRSASLRTGSGRGARQLAEQHEGLAVRAHPDGLRGALVSPLALVKAAGQVV